MIVYQMIEKQYKNIKEVAKELNIKEHVIRYWDSIDHKTNKIRFHGLSTRNPKGIRFFNKENIKKLEQLKNLLYENGKHNHTLALANKIISNKKNSLLNNTTSHIYKSKNHSNKLNEIINKLRALLDENN